MRTIEEYMKLPYRIELIPDPDEGGFVVTFPDLPGCPSLSLNPIPLKTIPVSSNFVFPVHYIVNSRFNQNAKASV